MTKKAARNLSIENVPLGILKLDRRNPRQHSRQQIAQIARSIEAFGFNVPILVDESLTVLAGHGRAQAGQQIGLQEVPIIRLAHLSEAQARAFSIADNRLTDNSPWDDRLLGEIFRDLSAVELEFKLEATGFSIAEIDLSIEGLTHKRTAIQTQPTTCRPPRIAHRSPRLGTFGSLEGIDCIAAAPLMRRPTRS